MLMVLRELLPSRVKRRQVSKQPATPIRRISKLGALGGGYGSVKVSGSGKDAFSSHEG